MGTVSMYPLPRPVPLADLSPTDLKRADENAKFVSRVIGRLGRIADLKTVPLDRELAGTIAAASQALRDYDLGFEPNEFTIMRLQTWAEQDDSALGLAGTV